MMLLTNTGSSRDDLFRRSIRVMRGYVELRITIEAGQATMTVVEAGRPWRARHWPKADGF